MSTLKLKRPIAEWRRQVSLLGNNAAKHNHARAERRAGEGNRISGARDLGRLRLPRSTK